MLCTTYAVGELSALNGVMGAKAERSAIFHLVSMPSQRYQHLHKVMHHTLGDGVFQRFINISAQSACVHTILTPDNCVYEMERMIAKAIFLAESCKISGLADNGWRLMQISQARIFEKIKKILTNTKI